MLYFLLSLMSILNKTESAIFFLYFGLVALEEGSSFTRFFFVKRTWYLDRALSDSNKSRITYQFPALPYISLQVYITCGFIYKNEFHFRLKTSLGMQRYNVVDIRGNKHSSIETINRSIKELNNISLNLRDVLLK